MLCNGLADLVDLMDHLNLPDLDLPDLSKLLDLPHLLELPDLLDLLLLTPSRI